MKNCYSSTRIKYTINNMEEVYTDVSPDFTKMRGTINTHSFSSLLNYVENNNRTESSTGYLEQDDCPSYTNDDGDGGSSSNTGNGSSGGGSSGGTGNGDGENGDSGDGGTGDMFDFPHFEDPDGECNINIWSNGTTGELIGITWSCTDGSSGSFFNRSESGDGDCPEEGDIAINDGDDIVDGPEDPIDDMETYLNCFNTSQDATVTFYADQPNPEHPNYDHWMGDVGHSFITIEQNGNRVTYGFWADQEYQVSGKKRK